MDSAFPYTDREGVTRASCPWKVNSQAARRDLHVFVHLLVSLHISLVDIFAGSKGFTAVTPLSHPSR